MPERNSTCLVLVIKNLTPSQKVIRKNSLKKIHPYSNCINNYVRSYSQNATRIFLLIKNNNEPYLSNISLVLLLSPMTVRSDERIYETKNICGRYYAAEINGGETARLLGLKATGREGSRVEQYCNFFR